MEKLLDKTFTVEDVRQALLKVAKEKIESYQLQVKELQKSKESSSTYTANPNLIKGVLCKGCGKVHKAGMAKCSMGDVSHKESSVTNVSHETTAVSKVEGSESSQTGTASQSKKNQDRQKDDEKQGKKVPDSKEISHDPGIVPVKEAVKKAAGLPGQAAKPPNVGSPKLPAAVKSEKEGLEKGVMEFAPGVGPAGQMPIANTNVGGQSGTVGTPVNPNLAPSGLQTIGTPPPVKLVHKVASLGKPVVHTGPERRGWEQRSFAGPERRADYRFDDEKAPAPNPVQATGAAKIAAVAQTPIAPTAVKR
jgi:hypothetical protein